MARHKIEPKNKLTKIIEKKAQRHLAAEKMHTNLWKMSSFFGLVGFSIVVPLAIFIGLGRYLEIRIQSPVSFTIIGIVLGLMIGGFNTWRWIQKEEKIIEKGEKK